MNGYLLALIMFGTAEAEASTEATCMAMSTSGATSLYAKLCLGNPERLKSARDRWDDAMTAYMEALASASPEELAKLKTELDAATEEVDSAPALGRKCQRVTKLLPKSP